MSKNAYEILGVDPNCNDTELDEAYYNLRSQYRNDMYQEGALGKAAAKKLTELEDAYREVREERASRQRGEDNLDEGTKTESGIHSAAFGAVESCLRSGDLRGAQDALDNVSVRDAEWHYFQAVIYYKKGWMSEAKNQMEMACNMDSANAHYKEVLGKLNNAIEGAGNPANKGYNDATQGTKDGGYRRSYAEQDARASEDACCRWCQTLICINCLCDCCCRG